MPPTTLVEAALAESWRTYLATRSVEARNALWEHYYRLPRHVVARMRGALPRATSAADMTADGQFGLKTAIEKYRPERGNFISFAMALIRYAVVDANRAREGRSQRQIQGRENTVNVGDEINGLVQETNQEAVDNLDVWIYLPNHHAVLMRLYYRGMSMRTLAELYGWTLGRVSQIHALTLRAARAQAAKTGGKLATRRPWRGTALAGGTPHAGIKCSGVHVGGHE